MQMQVLGRHLVTTVSAAAAWFLTDTWLQQSLQQQHASCSGDLQRGGLCSKSAASVHAENRPDWHHTA